MRFFSTAGFRFKLGLAGPSAHPGMTMGFVQESSMARPQWSCLGGTPDGARAVPLPVTAAPPGPARHALRTPTVPSPSLTRRLASMAIMMVPLAASEPAAQRRPSIAATAQSPAPGQLQPEGRGGSRGTRPGAHLGDSVVSYLHSDLKCACTGIIVVSLKQRWAKPTGQ